MPFLLQTYFYPLDFDLLLPPPTSVAPPFPDTRSFGIAPVDSLFHMVFMEEILPHLLVLFAEVWGNLDQ